MNILKRSFFKTQNQQHGSMLLELLLSVALISIIIPFVFKYQTEAIKRAENIAITNQMTDIQNALERYITTNRNQLLKTIGKNITRIEMEDLLEYGLNENILQNSETKYQLRILKSTDINNKSILQGIVVATSDDITPMRTREIVGIAGSKIGFIDGTKAYGAFGTWRTDTSDLGIQSSNGLIGTTSTNRNNTLYLWRLPSDDPSDATMMTNLNLGAHDVLNSNFVNMQTSVFNEFLHGGAISTHNLIFQNRTNIDETFSTKNATVSGNLSSDSRNFDISGRFYLTELGKFSNFTTNDLWVSNLTLSGLSVDNPDSKPAYLNINGKLDMTYGRINALFVSVGYSGSITPRLVVNGTIKDSNNTNYYWNTKTGEANLSDLSLPELNRMASLIVKQGNISNTVSTNLFNATAKKTGATVKDFIKTIDSIQTNVKAKYSLLNFE